MANPSYMRPDSCFALLKVQTDAFKGYTFRHSSEVRFYRLIFIPRTGLTSTFAGHSPEWASPKDQRAWFANISGAILKPVEQGHDEL